MKIIALSFHSQHTSEIRLEKWSSCICFESTTTNPL